MPPTLASDAKLVSSPLPPLKAARVSLIAYMEERLFGVSLLGMFVGAAGLSILAVILRWLVGSWLEWLEWFYGNALAGFLTGATAGGLFAMPVLIMAAVQPGKGRARRIRAALPAWAGGALAIAVVGGLGESIGGWAGWMIGGMLVGALAGRFLETE